MLKIKDLYVNYGNVSALRGISMEIRKNEIVSLIGSNGAGKTSTLMGISGLVPKSGGQILYHDLDITSVSSRRIVQERIAHVPEGRHIFPRMTVEENLIVGSMGNRGMTKGQLRLAIEQQYEMFPRLRERRKQMGGTLSGGEQQMLAISRGMMSDPELVMFDEPSLGLAPIVAAEIFEMIVRIKKSGKTILLIEQNASMALSISDRAYVLETGRIVMEGTGRALIEDENVKKAYLGI